MRCLDGGPVGGDGIEGFRRGAGITLESYDFKNRAFNVKAPQGVVTSPSRLPFSGIWVILVWCVGLALAALSEPFLQQETSESEA